MWAKFKEIAKELKEEGVKVEKTAELPLDLNTEGKEGLQIITNEGRIFLNQEGKILVDEVR